MAPRTTTTLTRWCSHLSRRKLPRSVLSSVPITLAFITSVIILVYNTSFFVRSRISPSTTTVPSFGPPSTPFKSVQHVLSAQIDDDELGISSSNLKLLDDDDDHANNSSTGGTTDHLFVSNVSSLSPSSDAYANSSSSGSSKEEEVFHDKEIFLQNYNEMKRTLKIYIYPHPKNHPFANALLPVDNKEPGGNYASETYFKNVLFKSDFITNDPSEADLFFLPFSIARLRHDSRVGVGGLSDFIKHYMVNISTDYPYWNRTGGADHFYVACHSIGRMAMEKVEYVKANAIQVVCSSSYFLPNYYSHKDVGLPQIWPRHEEPPNLASTKSRKKLAFFAGSMNSPARKAVLQSWQNDTAIFAYSGRLKTPYSEQLLRSKYCLHVKGFEVNTARIGDALYYGCVPVILADYYDLPFMDILNWRSFSVVVRTSDIPNLKKILQKISPKEYSVLHGNVLKVRKHFQWNRNPLDFDVFYMVMYELWLRRSSIRVLF